MTNLTKQEQAEVLGIAIADKEIPGRWKNMSSKRQVLYFVQAKPIADRLHANGFEIVRKETPNETA